MHRSLDFVLHVSSTHSNVIAASLREACMGINTSMIHDFGDIGIAVSLYTWTSQLVLVRVTFMTI